MITLFLEQADKQDLDDLLAALHGEVEIATVKGFDGLSELAQIVVPLTAITATFIYNIVKEKVRSKRYVAIKFQGIEISGVDEERITAVLATVMEKAGVDMKTVEKLEVAEQEQTNEA